MSCRGSQTKQKQNLRKNTLKSAGKFVKDSLVATFLNTRPCKTYILVNDNKTIFKLETSGGLNILLII